MKIQYTYDDDDDDDDDDDCDDYDDNDKWYVTCAYKLIVRVGNYMLNRSKRSWVDPDF